tara:strand:- start:34 stop:957 length:924 start_codon:yes stop_codon:yes gene_type:complete
MAFSSGQHSILSTGDLDFVPESDWRYLPVDVRLKLLQLEKINGKVYLPEDEVASLKREIAAEKMSEVAKRNDPDAYFGGDPEYSSTPITDDPAELRGRLGTNQGGVRPTIYRALDHASAVFNERYLPTGKYESQYKESEPIIYGKYTTPSQINRHLTKGKDEILLPPTVSYDDMDPFTADYINFTEPHEYMHRGLMPTNPISKYLLGPIDSMSERLGIGNLFGTRVFAGNQHTYIDKALSEHKQKKAMEDFEIMISKMSPQQRINYKKYLEAQREKDLRSLQEVKNRTNKSTGGEIQSSIDLLQKRI